MIEIAPTTTLAQLTQNNTSAADSFPGWVNGMAKAGNVSHEPLGIPQMKLIHGCFWWGSSSHPNIGINCADPAYCAKCAADAKARGLDGFLLDWYGQGHQTDKSLLVLRPELEKQGLKFALCVDGGMAAIKAATTDAARTLALLTAINYARHTYFTSPAYLKDGGKFVILFFGFSTADFDWMKIQNALQPDCKLIFRWELNYSNRSYADGYFGWTHCDETWIADVKKRAPGKLIFLGINGGFDSSHKEDPIRCSWGSGNIIAQNGGLRMQEQLALAAAHPEIPYTSINTFNDYQEGSALEPGLASGKPLALTLGTGTLVWSNTGAAFDHYSVFVSKDGQNFGELGIKTTDTWLDLGALDFAPGTYYFLVRAIGKPFVQNILSNTVAATLAWK